MRQLLPVCEWHVVRGEPDSSRWSRRWRKGGAKKEQLRVVLDEVSAKTDTVAEKLAQLPGFYAAS